MSEVLAQGENTQDKPDPRVGVETAVSSLEDSIVSELADSKEQGQPRPVLIPACNIADYTSISAAPHTGTSPFPHADTSVHMDSHTHRMMAVLEHVQEGWLSQLTD